MRKSLQILFLSTFISGVLQAKPLDLDQSGEVESIIFVNGVARKASLNVSKSKTALFSRERFVHKSARFVEVVSPNTVRVDVSGKHENVQLLGLMDMSPKAHGKLRSDIQKVIHNKLARKSVKIYIPREASQDEYNHGYIIAGSRLLNAELLREGFGIMAADSMIDPLLLPQFTSFMQEAITSRRGVWNPKRLSKDDSYSTSGIEVRNNAD